MGMKIALVHDWIKDISGAERVLIELHEMYPHAPIYTLFYDPKFASQILPDAEIRSSFLQKFPFILRHYSWYAWLMPAAIESLDLSGFDTIISSSAIFSKGLVLRPQIRHICYCYSPTRMLWDLSSKTKFSFFKHFFRFWDKSSATRPTEFIAISQTVADRIKKYYRRDSQVVYPGGSNLTHADARQKPTDFCAMSPATRLRNVGLESDYYLIVSRLYPHKNIDVAIQAFNKLEYPLVIIGDGPGRKKLQRLASSNVTFLGHQSDEVVSAHYAACRAFIMPQEEDFGLTPIEAMSYGKPIVALRRGGATETIVEGITGEFFDDPIPEALADALRRLNDNYPKYNPTTIRAHAAKFSSEIFRTKLKTLIEN